MDGDLAAAVTEGDHDHEFDADARFVENNKEAADLARYVAAKLNAGWQITAMSLASAGQRIFGVTVTVRDVPKRPKTSARRRPK